MTWLGNRQNQAYTECKKKIFSIANTHAIIMFEMNIESNANTDEELDMLKQTIEKSFSTLEFCITQDIRINYHVLVYAKNAIRYYNKFGLDYYAGKYIASALFQLSGVFASKDYIFPSRLRELKSLEKELKNIKLNV